MAAQKPRQTKQDRREAAREAARRLREEQERTEKRNRFILIGVVSLIVVLAVAAVFMILGQRNKSPFDGLQAKPAGSDNNGGIPISKELKAGTPATGGVRVNIFGDYTCIHCANLEKINGEDIKKLVQEGKINLWIHPVPILEASKDYSGYAGRAAHAAGLVATYAPEKFLDFHQRLFSVFQESQGKAGADEIKAAAKSLGIADDVIARFDTSEYHKWLDATKQSFLKQYQGTPVLLLDNKRFDGWNQPGALATAVQQAAGK